MDQQPAFQLSFDFLRSKPIVVEPSAAQVSSDAGSTTIGLDVRKSKPN